MFRADDAAGEFMAFRAVTTVCLLSVLCAPAFGQDHDHKPMILPGKPSISRIQVSFAVPHRVRFDGSGNVLVADKRAGVVFRTAPDGITAVLADGLNEPVALATDEDGNAYIATAAKGRTAASEIYKVTPEGDRETLVEGLTGLTDIVRDPSGVLTIALGKQNKVISVDPDGERKVLIDRVAHPTALARGNNGELLIASAKGQVWQLLPGNRLRKLVDDLKSPSDLAVMADGRIVVAATGEKKLTVLQRGEQPKAYAKVLLNTNSIAFSAIGNMVVTNRELQSVTRVTSRFTGTCTHENCDAEVQVILRAPKPKRSAF